MIDKYEIHNDIWCIISFFTGGGGWYLWHCCMMCEWGGCSSLSDGPRDMCAKAMGSLHLSLWDRPCAAAESVALPGWAEVKWSEVKSTRIAIEQYAYHYTRSPEGLRKISKSDCTCTGKSVGIRPTAFLSCIVYRIRRVRLLPWKVWMSA